MSGATRGIGIGALIVLGGSGGLAGQISLQKGEITFRANYVPAPTGVVVTGSGITAMVSWQPVVGANSYFVMRWAQWDPNCCKLASPAFGTTAWQDTGLQWPGTYVYRVGVNYSDGRVGTTDVTFTRPAPQDPTGFSAVQIADGQVKLAWQPVAGVATYLVSGPGAGNTGATVTGTTVTLSGVPVGTQQWTVASLYSPGGLLTPSANWPRASLTTTATIGTRIYCLQMQAAGTTITDRGGWIATQYLTATSWPPFVNCRPTGAVRHQSIDIEAHQGRDWFFSGTVLANGWVVDNVILGTWYPVQAGAAIDSFTKGSNNLLVSVRWWTDFGALRGSNVTYSLVVVIKGPVALPDGWLVR